MPNTKRSYKEPDRSPLQVRASSLLSTTFPTASPAPRGRNRPSSVRHRGSAIKPTAAGSHSSQQQSSTSQPASSTRCASLSLEGNTAHILAPSTDQLLLPTNLLHLDSLDDAEFDLQDLILDEGDDVLTELPAHGQKAAGRSDAAVAAATAAAGAQDEGGNLPTGALLCQQLSQHLSGQHTPSPDQQPPADNAPVQQQQRVKQDEKPLGGTHAAAPAADATFNSGNASPLVDGTAYIMESSVQVGHLQTETSAGSDAGAAATTDESDRFTAIDTMLEQLSVDAMLQQQFTQYQQQQQQCTGQSTAADTGNAVAYSAAMPQQSNNPSGLLQPQQQQYNQWVDQAPAATAASSMQPVGINPAGTQGVGHQNLPTLPQAWQQLQSSAYGTPETRTSAAAPVMQQHSEQQFINASASLQPFSFQALLLDEETPVSQQQAQQQQQQQLMPQSGLNEAAQQEQLAGTPASNYMLLQQQQHQRRLMLQQQQVQMHSFPSASFNASGPSSAAPSAAPYSLPNTLAHMNHSPLPAAGQMAQQDIHSHASFTNFTQQQQVSYPAHFNSGGTTTNMSGAAPLQPPKPIITTGATNMQYRNATPEHPHVNAGPQSGYPPQAPPQQQMSASQQELQALKQQLAEEKRRRKEKKKLKKMHKLLEQQQQQQQYGDLNRQQSGLSQQVLSAACHQHQFSPVRAPGAAGAAAAAAGGHYPGPPSSAVLRPPLEVPPAARSPFGGTTNLMPQPGAVPQGPNSGPEQQTGGLSQQHSWPQPASDLRTAHSNPHRTYQRSHSHTEYMGKPAVDQRWQQRGGNSGNNNSSPHAVAAGYPIDCASASCQQAVAESLRQLAKKPERHQQYSRASDGQHHAAAAGGVAQANAMAHGRSPTPTQLFEGSNSGRYSPFSGYAGNQTPLPNAEPLPVQQTQMDGNNIPQRSGVVESQVGADLPMQHSRLPTAGSAVPSPAGLESPNQMSSSAGAAGAAAERAASQLVGSSAGFDHSRVLPGVPVVLDLGDKEPDSQAQPGLASNAVVPSGLQVDTMSSDGVTLQQQQVAPDAADSQNQMVMSAASASMQKADAMQGSVLMGSTDLPAAQQQGDMQFKAADLTGHASGPQVGGFDQTVMMAGQPMSGAASPTSTTSSGRKRTYDQTSCSMQDVRGDSSSLPASISASPTDQAFMGQSAQAPAAGVAAAAAAGFGVSGGLASNMLQQQAPGGSSQRKARLLQLPFNGLDLAEKRDRQRDAVITMPDQPHRPSTAPLQQGGSSQLSAAMLGAVPSPMHPGHMPGQPMMMQHNKTNSASEFGASWWPADDTEMLDARAAAHRRHASMTSGTTGAAPAGSRDMLSPRDSARMIERFRDQGSFTEPRATMGMPPPPPQVMTGAGAQQGAGGPAAAAAPGSGSPGDSSGGGGGFNPVLGAGNIYRTSSGKVLRMLTHPVTGKPLLLGPAVDAKSSRLGNTSLGAPAPQLFGCELQTNSNSGNANLGPSAGSAVAGSTSIMSGASSLGSPGHSSSNSFRGECSGSNRIRRHNSLRARRRSNPGPAQSDVMDVQYPTGSGTTAAAGQPLQPPMSAMSNPAGVNAAGLTGYPSLMSTGNTGDALFDQYAANAAQGLNSARSLPGGNVHQEVPRGEYDKSYNIGVPPSEINESWGAGFNAPGACDYNQVPAFGDDELLLGQGMPNQQVVGGQPYDAAAANAGMLDLLMGTDVPSHLA